MQYYITIWGALKIKTGKTRVDEFIHTQSTGRLDNTVENN